MWLFSEQKQDVGARNAMIAGSFAARGLSVSSRASYQRGREGDLFVTSLPTTGLRLWLIGSIARPLKDDDCTVPLVIHVWYLAYEVPNFICDGALEGADEEVRAKVPAA